MTLAIYLILMAGVTYLIRMLPFVLMRRKIQSRFLRSFLYYAPYAVLSAMTFPAILYSTGNMLTALCGLVAALVLAYLKFSLTLVAMLSAATVFATSFIF